MNQNTIQPISTKQAQLFNELIVYIKSKSLYYKGALADSPDSVHSLEDLAQFPFTTKETIQNHYHEMVCVPHRDILEYATTSGTLGKPISIPLTKNDLRRLALNEFYSFQKIGLSADDVVQLVLTLDKQFMAGMAYYLGAQELGATVLRTGPGMIAQQFEAIRNYHTSCLVAVPSFVIQMLEYAKQQNINLNKLTVKKILCIGEPIRNIDFTDNEIASRIKALWNVELYSTYASTEMQTAFTECKCAQGGHLQPDLLFVEVLDSNGRHVGNGESGEVVVSTFGVEAMPLFRYKTGDIAHYYATPCSCGWQSVRLGPVVGRQKQMIKYKGTTLYPQTIAEAIHKVKEVSNYIIEVFKNEFQQDDFVLYLSLNDNADVDYVQKSIQDTLRVKPKLVLCSLEELKARQYPEHSRKPIKFVDKR